MHVAINLGPNADWNAMLSAAQMADKLGFDALGFLDHYHADKLEWPYICGWSAYGVLAAVTSRIHLVPMVIDRLNYLPGVLAKEATTLSIASAGRFELGIGAGDFFEEMRAWGVAIPDAPARIAGLKETVTILRHIWQGEQVTFEGAHLHLKKAASTPVPPQPIRVVVGAGSSKHLIQSAVEYADEINVYADDNVIRFAQQAIASSHRPVSLSVYAPWDLPEEDIATKLATWGQLGVERTFLTFWPPFDKIPAAVKYMS